MDILDEDLIHFWTILNKHDIKYIMVGGFAMTFNGYINLTAEIDLYIDDNLFNRQNVSKAFQKLGMGDLELLEHKEFDKHPIDFKFGDDFYINILTSLKGVDLSFDECLAIAPLQKLKV